MKSEGDREPSSPETLFVEAVRVAVNVVEIWLMCVGIAFLIGALALAFLLTSHGWLGWTLVTLLTARIVCCVFSN
jgi:fatty acid desaturase